LSGITVFQAIVITIIGLAASIIGSLSGGGGGNLVVPAIVSLVNVKPSVLVGSVFFMYLVSSITGLFAYNRKGLVDYRSGITLSLPCIPGVVLGTFLENAISDFEFKAGLGALTATLAIIMYVQERRSKSIVVARVTTDQPAATPEDMKNSPRNRYGDHTQKVLKDKSGRIFSYSPNITLGLLINFFAGLLAGTFGAGAGVIIIPTTILVVRLPSHVAVATTRIVLLVLDLAALATHIGIGAFDIAIAILLSIGSVIGSILGAHIAFKISPGLLTYIVAIVFGAIGLYLILTSF
jgi:uncharacterized protein